MAGKKKQPPIRGPLRREAEVRCDVPFADGKLLMLIVRAFATSYGGSAEPGFEHTSIVVHAVGGQTRLIRSRRALLDVANRPPGVTEGQLRYDVEGLLWACTHVLGFGRPIEDVELYGFLQPRLPFSLKDALPRIRGKHLQFSTLQGSQDFDTWTVRRVNFDFARSTCRVEKYRVSQR